MDVVGVMCSFLCLLFNLGEAGYLLLVHNDTNNDSDHLYENDSNNNINGNNNRE